MRLTVAMISLAALAACETPVPDSGAGVGFGSYAEYQAQREAELISIGEGSGVATGLDTQTITQEAAAAIDAAESSSVTSSTSKPAVVTNAAGISAENDFSAVSSERSIEEDAALVEANKQAYVTIQPTAVPERPAGDAGTIVEFALSTTNNVGEALYSRLIPGAAARAARNCAKYPSADLAQEDFLKNGGPERNAKGLDPDGDGFACSWDPAPFRLAAQARR
ncbi:hypothetical protein [Celeribacter halophilus]|uniref:hypothetical protein n=1 Tax=Celeribacter halophilus TaxID=576117 RepID=UPI001C09BE22|nr:hypothetical protein [Celeribacter halophilus]MBU2889423.1 hypothetical protein [Celeribacter halophilus]MDO6509339.1 hypothetical protein [Celeribacter halophilus]